LAWLQETGVTLATGTWESLWRLQHRSGLIVVNGERPKPGRGDIFWQKDFVGFGTVERLSVLVDLKENLAGTFLPDQLE
jgi:hypothetical protein